MSNTTPAVPDCSKASCESFTCQLKGEFFVIIIHYSAKKELPLLSGRGNSL
jgi:hypothetical protein